MDDQGVTQQEVEAALEKQQTILNAMHELYLKTLEESMGQLHNQFVAFISESKLPLPQVTLVLQMLLKEATEQAFKKYMGN